MKLQPGDYPEEYWRRRAVVSRAGYRYRRDVLGMSPREAATTPRRKGAKCAVYGDSSAEKCRAAGINPDRLYQWRKRKPNDSREDAEIIAEMVERDERVKREREACAEAGVPRGTVRSRMSRQGISFEEALRQRTMSKQEIGRKRYANIKARKGAGKGVRRGGKEGEKSRQCAKAENL